MSCTRRLLTLGAIAVIAASGIAIADTIPGQGGAVSFQMQEMMQHHHARMSSGAVAGPTMAGQAAFGAIQEIVSLLEADPDTDWSKVDLSALREHLIDMDEVTLRAAAAEKQISGGLEIAVTGDGRTLQAIQRMVPAHAQEIDGLQGWQAKAGPLANGILLSVIAADPKEVAHIRGLGFIGLLASGSHHQQHHLAMAKGEQHVH